jgi:hypothetical protein
MVPDVSTGDFTRMLCLNCARRSVSPKSSSKYGALSKHLKFRSAFTDTVRLPFSKIDGIISDNLPMSAYKTESWWGNTPTNVHAKAWLDAGWNVQEVNLKEGYVVFKKVKEIKARRFMRKASRSEIKKPFTPVRVRISESRKPSKTKVAKLYARLKNIERNRTYATKHPRGFKPKPAFEKKLFKSEEKPK